MLWFGLNYYFTKKQVLPFVTVLCIQISNVFFLFFLPLLIWFLTAHCLLFLSPLFFLSSCLFASVLLRWLRCCSSVWQPSYFWGIPWVWRGASIRFSPSLYKPSGLDGRQSVRRGHCSCQRRRLRVSSRGRGLGSPPPRPATCTRAGAEGTWGAHHPGQLRAPGPDCCFEKEVLAFSLLLTELKAPLSKSANKSFQGSFSPWGGLTSSQPDSIEDVRGYQLYCYPLLRRVLVGRAQFSC